MSTPIRVACIDSEAPPLFNESPDGKTRTGYEPEAAELVFSRLDRAVEWVFMNWEDMLPAVAAGEVDAVWCGQGVIPERAAVVDFTDPYAIFHETVLVRTGDETRSPEGLVGRRVGAIAGSANMKLAETFEGAVLVPFEGENVYHQMIDALRNGSIEAFVDDDVVMLPLAESDPDFVEAFTVQTANPWAIGVKPGDDELREAINGALADVVADGSLEKVWKKWMPELEFPLGGEEEGA